MTHLPDPKVNPEIVAEKVGVSIELRHQLLVKRSNVIKFLTARGFLEKDEKMNQSFDI